MAKKTRQKKKSSAARRPSAPPRPVSPAPTTTPGTRSAAMPPTAMGATAGAAAAPPARRGVQRVDPAAPRQGGPARGRGTDTGFKGLDPQDPAIPFDRVPYVPADLRRVAIMALVMVLLIIVANLVISHLTG